MTYYRDQRRGGRVYRHEHDHLWPHSDRRGPDYFYDEERYPERSYDPYYQDNRSYSRMDNDSDIYEDEFFPGADRGRDYRAPREHWPEDRFYYHRQQLRPRENFFQRGWHRLRDEWRGMNGQGPAYYGRYPEDHHHGSYGREFEAENANRGPWIHERFRW